MPLKAGLHAPLLDAQLPDHRSTFVDTVLTRPHPNCSCQKKNAAKKINRFGGVIWLRG
jgi:hypothetical protein